MTEKDRETARGILTRYLQEGNHRKTPERYAILDAAYRTQGLFSMEELSRQLEVQGGLVVSRATLYSTVKLLVALGLLVKHHVQGYARYAAVQKKKGCCQQICTVCGKVKDLNMSEMTTSFEDIRMKDCSVMTSEINKKSQICLANNFIFLEYFLNKLHRTCQY